MAKYISKQFLNILKIEAPSLFNQNLKKVVLKVYEDKGKCGIFTLNSFEEFSTNYNN